MGSASRHQGNGKSQHVSSWAGKMGHWPQCRGADCEPRVETGEQARPEISCCGAEPISRCQRLASTSFLGSRREPSQALGRSRSFVRAGCVTE